MMMIRMTILMKMFIDCFEQLNNQHHHYHHYHHFYNHYYHHHHFYNHYHYHHHIYHNRFIHPTTGQESHAYRITYRHMDRSLTNAEINEIQQSVRQKLETNLKVVLR